MEIFEVHITGDERIIEACKKFDIKTISVDLLRPDGSKLRTEHMTSTVVRFTDYSECIQNVLELRDKIQRWCGVHRVKVECPVYDHYLDRSLYIESHFDTTDNLFPISRNAKKATWMGTDRTYDHAEYDEFRERWKGETIELALFDSNLEEDWDWLELWGK
jgi:hypothetical protein